MIFFNCINIIIKYNKATRSPEISCQQASEDNTTFPLYSGIRIYISIYPPPNFFSKNVGNSIKRKENMKWENFYKNSNNIPSI